MLEKNGSFQAFSTPYGCLRARGSSNFYCEKDVSFSVNYYYYFKKLKGRECMSGKGLSENGYEVTTAEICEIMGFSPRRIQQLVKEKAVVRASHGRYDLRATFTAYLNYEKEKIVSDNPDLDKLREETLWTRARRKKTEAELGIITGKLHRSKDVENIMNSMMMSFRAQLLSFSSRLAPKVQGKKDLIEIQELVKDEVEVLMRELKDYDPDVFYEESDDVIATDEPLAGENVE